MTTTTIMRWAREQRAGHVIAKSILLVLAAHADRTGACRPSYRLIAEEAEAGETSVRRHLTTLVEQGLVVRTVGAGRTATRYQLAIPTSPDRVASAPPTGAQHDPPSAPPERRTTTAACAPSGARSAPLDPRSAPRQAADQQKREHEVVPTELEELQEEPPSAATRASARPQAQAPARGRRGELVPATELNRTATSSAGALAVVTAWVAAQPPGFRTGAKRDLKKAVGDLLAERQIDPALIPAALDEAHRNDRFRNPAKCLAWAYDEVWRRHHAPARASPPTNRADQTIAGLLGLDPWHPPRPIGDT